MSHTRDDPRCHIRRAVSPSEVTELRDLLTNTILASPNLYHPVDIERIRGSDWQLIRFLERAPDVRTAYTAIDRTLQWKRESGLHDKRDEEFAKEFYDINGVEILGRNQDGALVVWNTSKYNKHFSELKHHIKQFVLHEIETLDAMAGPAGMILVSDTKHAGLLSVDIEITRYSNEIVAQHYPGAVRSSLILNLSSLLNPLFQIVLKFMNAEMRATTRVVTKSTLASHLESHFIPEEYGGTRKGRAVRIPDQAPSYTEIPEIVLTQAQKARYTKLIANLPA